MSLPRLATLLAVPALALSLAACGGGGDSDEDKIKSVIQDVARDAATICEHSTQKILDNVGGSVEECKKQAEANPDDSSEEVKGEIEVSVDGDKATARFTDNDGVEQNVSFVKDGDDWLVDAVE